MLIDVIVIAATAAQLTTLSLWLNARARANEAWGFVDALMAELNHLNQTAVKRDPKTGRYLKKGK